MSLDMARFTGIGQFGPAYRVMFENDCHAPGSVDRLILQQMVRLCEETAAWLYGAFTPHDVGYEAGSRPELEAIIRPYQVRSGSADDVVSDIATFCSALADKVEDRSMDELVFGGTEEEIIERRSDWCADVARVGCALCQVARIPSRMVYLADPQSAYSGHVITEAFRYGKWGAVDVLTGVIYRDHHAGPASAWDLLKKPHLIDLHYRGEQTPFTVRRQFAGVAIANYCSWDRARWDYATSKVNPYYRAILVAAQAGWPGGLRWLHQEDQAS